MSRIPVAGLHQPVVVPRGEEHHLLGPRGVDDATRVGPDLGAPGEHAQVERLQVGERVVRPLDEEHRLPRLDLVAVIQGVHLELVPLGGAQLEDGDRLVDAAEKGVRFAEHLHGHAGAMAVLEEQLPRSDEVLIRVVPLPHALDGEVEDRGMEPRFAGHR